MTDYQNNINIFVKENFIIFRYKEEFYLKAVSNDGMIEIFKTVNEDLRLLHYIESFSDEYNEIINITTKQKSDLISEILNK